MHLKCFVVCFILYNTLKNYLSVGCEQFMATTIINIAIAITAAATTTL